MFCKTRTRLFKMSSAPPVKYKGLQNQGATCYLNSVLQVLFMTKEFREKVERATSSTARPPLGYPDKADILAELKSLFDELEHGDGSVSTRGITNRLHIDNVYQQQDAVEWFQKILSELGEGVTKDFQGNMQQLLKCSKKGHDVKEDNKFISVLLPVGTENDRVYDVKECLEDFFKSTMLDEDDWMYCDQCDDKTIKDVSCEIERHPTILALHIKRFYFDYMRHGFVKNCCRISIPSHVTLQKSEYDLYGVINHRGGYQGGHYDAYINPPEDGGWYCFDDGRVQRIADDFMKSSETAYLILYRKSKQPKNKKRKRKRKKAASGQKKKRSRRKHRWGKRH
ncbi:ubiquitin carboxyl-terminal hydrolase 47-like [Denticeps clupeoides]|uniref:ubiquitin carboxyl-terminal hydrolase 47-like n=1 Tax=Denticeps clupeoides TaxID=299321 RepID=UPI0010A3FD71|nr:ubiquitin carboxyl-terminal hydrolase 47-like [Denticeps clupeoides]